MNPKSRAPRELVLTPVRGMTDPREPVPLNPDGVITIGRSGDIKCHDTLVNVRHAEIYLDPEGTHFVVRDMASTNGTLVDGEVVHDGVRRIKAGTELRLGDTTLRVERPRRTPRWWPWLVIVPLAIIACAGSGVVLLRQFQDHRITLSASEDIWIGARNVHEVEVPPEFLRSRGLPWHLSIRQVSDYDGDGRSELWLDVNADPPEQLIVTFDDQDQLVELGRLPARQCAALEGRDRFPTLDCDDEEWTFDPELGRYQPTNQEGAVVWFRDAKARKAPPAPAAKPAKPKLVRGKPAPAPAPPPPQPTVVVGTLGPLKVARVAIKDPIALGAFLADRGVYDDVQYIICEGFADGVRAQVLSAAGLVLPLEPGCIGELRLEGKSPADPYAVAFTPAGARALVNDLQRFYSGGADDMFLSADKAAVIAPIQARPGPLHGSTRLVADVRDQLQPIPSPIPAGDTPVNEIHVLEAADRLHVPPPSATTVVVPGEAGTYEFPVPDHCERLIVRVGDFEQPKGSCNNEFVRVDEVGCTGTPVRILTGRYSGGKSFKTTAGGLDVMLAVDKFEGVKEDRILRVRLAWRNHPPP